MATLDLELEALTHNISEKSIQILNRLQFKPEIFFSFIEKWMDLEGDFRALATVMLQHPQLVADCYSAYCKDAVALSQSFAVQTVPNDDGTPHPFFTIIHQHYQLVRQHLTAFLEQIHHDDPQLMKRLKFLLSHYLDALSPDNFLLTNPQILAETQLNQGKNLLRGLSQFLNDIERDPLRFVMTMTDKSAFQVGRDLAITPGKVIFKNELMELIQYTPQTKSVKSVPLLVIPPWINKYYILDLRPTNSLVCWLVAQGVTVFMISWRNPNKSHAEMGLAEYLSLGPLAAVEVIQQQLQVKTISALGFCIGGTLLSMLLAYYKARQLEVIRSATFLASLIDFTDPGEISVFIDEKQILALEKKVAQHGYLEGAVMAAAFNALRARDLIWSFFIRHYLQGLPPEPFDLLFWNSDTTNMPAKMYSEYLRWMYLANALMIPGKIILNETPLDIHVIDVPVFFLSTQKDHIAPWQSTYQGFLAMKGQKRFVLGGSGHIAGVVIPPGKEKYGYYTNPADPQDPAAWMQGAQLHPGSWWPEWLAWLKKYSGKMLRAPELACLPLQALADAPGDYVREPS